jgi:putative sterol carrier protein
MVKQDYPMDFLDEVVEKLTMAIASRPGPVKSLKINLKGLGVVVASSSSVKKEDSATDAAITISRTNLEKLVSGKLNPQMAYLQGKIEVDGDPMVALQWLLVIRGQSE